MRNTSLHALHVLRKSAAPIATVAQPARPSYWALTLRKMPAHRYWCKLHTLSPAGCPSPALPVLLRAYEALLQVRWCLDAAAALRTSGGQLQECRGLLGSSSPSAPLCHEAPASLVLSVRLLPLLLPAALGTPSIWGLQRFKHSGSAAGGALALPGRLRSSWCCHHRLMKSSLDAPLVPFAAVCLGALPG